MDMRRPTSPTPIFSQVLTSSSLAMNVVLGVALIATLAFKDKIYKDPTRGLIEISGSTVKWKTRCPTDKYAASLSNLHTTIKDYGVIQVGDKVWLCGGRTTQQDNGYGQSRTCLILDLLVGYWRAFEHKMVHPRIKPVMFVNQSTVFVMSGVTSDVNSKTGCRDTQEVCEPFLH